MEDWLALGLLAVTIFLLLAVRMERLGTMKMRVGKKIDAKHRLPCDFDVGGVIFRKGVKLETVRAAAQRWFRMADPAFGPKTKKQRDSLKKLIAGITPENLHPPIEPLRGGMG